METIFDYKPTEHELDELLGAGDVRETRDEYLEFLDSDGAFGDIFRLYWMRGEYDKADSFLTKIADPKYRQSVGLIGCQDHSHQTSDHAQFASVLNQLAA